MCDNIEILTIKGYNCDGELVKNATGEVNTVEISGRAQSQITNKLHEWITAGYDNILDTSERFQDKKPSVALYISNAEGKVIIAVIYDVKKSPSILGEEIYNLLKAMKK